MIRRIQVYADGVLKRIHAMLKPGSGEKIVSVRRVDVVSPQRLTTRDEIDAYTDNIRTKLYDALGDNDGIQII